MSLQISKIDKLRLRILKNLQELEENKHLIRSHDLTKLKNHHNFILSTFDNMINIKKVEQSDPWNNMQHADASASASASAVRNSAKTVVYNSDGTTRVVSNKELASTGEGWEHQFDPSMLVNPPCYIMPPQYLSSIKKIRSSGKQDRMRGL